MVTNKHNIAATKYIVLTRARGGANFAPPPKVFRKLLAREAREQFAFWHTFRQFNSASNAPKKIRVGQKLWKLGLSKVGVCVPKT